MWIYPPLVVVLLRIILRVEQRPEFPHGGAAANEWIGSGSDRPLVAPRD